MNGVAIVSGGLDSVTMAYMIRERILVDDGSESGTPDELTLVSFDYGQRHRKELEYAALAAQRLEADHVVVPMGALGELLPSALTDDDVAVPHGHYAADNMRTTVVPNRNMIMLSIAAGIAIARGAGFVAIGVHAGDHAVYPDCRAEFVDAMTATLRLANEGFVDPDFSVMAPYVYRSKTFIAAQAHELHVPVEDTWSCYEGGEIHCGACGTCVERREAFVEAGVPDPTVYESTPLFDAP